MWYTSHSLAQPLSIILFFQNFWTFQDVQHTGQNIKAIIIVLMSVWNLICIIKFFTWKFMCSSQHNVKFVLTGSLRHISVSSWIQITAEVLGWYVVHIQWGKSSSTGMIGLWETELEDDTVCVRYLEYMF